MAEVGAGPTDNSVDAEVGGKNENGSPGQWLTSECRGGLAPTIAVAM